MTQNFAVLVGIALGRFLLIGLTLGRSTVRALEGLAERAEALAAGDLSTTMASTGRIDEVGRTQSAFSETNSYLQTVGAQADALANSLEAQARQFSAVMDRAADGGEPAQTDDD